MIVTNVLSDAVKSALQDDWKGAEEWQREKAANPPFVVVHIGPTDLATSERTYIKDADDGENLVTYGAFMEVRQHLRRQRETAIDAAIMALSASFAAFNRKVTFREVDTIVAGRRPSGDWVSDMHVVGWAQGRAISPIDMDDLNIFLSRAARLSAGVPVSERHVFAMGIRDDDPLKRFQFLFLAIERQVNKAFKNIQPASCAEFVDKSDRMQQSLRDFLASEAMRTPLSLKSKFFFCTALLWTELGDDDVASFAQLVAVRNRLAHGEIVEPPGPVVQEVEAFASKLARVISGL